MPESSAPVSSMPRITLGVGINLVVVGLASFALTFAASWTALIPAILGAALIVCGLVARKSPKIGIHVALVVALAGIAGTFMNVLQIGELIAGTAERPIAVAASVVTFVLLVMYVVLGVRSFIAARRWRRTELERA